MLDSIRDSHRNIELDAMKNSLNRDLAPTQDELRSIDLGVSPETPSESNVVVRNSMISLWIAWCEIH